MATKKPQLPADPRFRGATPRKLVKALKRPKPKKDTEPTERRSTMKLSTILLAACLVWPTTAHSFDDGWGEPTDAYEDFWEDFETMRDRQRARRAERDTTDLWKDYAPDREAFELEYEARQEYNRNAACSGLLDNQMKAECWAARGGR